MPYFIDRSTINQNINFVGREGKAFRIYSQDTGALVWHKAIYNRQHYSYDLMLGKTYLAQGNKLVLLRCVEPYGPLRCAALDLDKGSQERDFKVGWAEEEASFKNMLNRGVTCNVNILGLVEGR